MIGVSLDERGLVIACPQCSQRNRMIYPHLDQPARCGRCKSDLPVVNAPIDVELESHFTSLVHASPLPVLIDFWAPWCGPCKMMAPELKKVAGANQGQMIVAKVNTEDLPVIAQLHEISSLPTLVLFVEGREAGRISGARPAHAIREWLLGMSALSRE